MIFYTIRPCTQTNTHASSVLTVSRGVLHCFRNTHFANSFMKLYLGNSFIGNIVRITFGPAVSLTLSLFLSLALALSPPFFETKSDSAKAKIMYVTISRWLQILLAYVLLKLSSSLEHPTKSITCFIRSKNNSSCVIAFVLYVGRVCLVG